MTSFLMAEGDLGSWQYRECHKDDLGEGSVSGSLGSQTCVPFSLLERQASPCVWTTIPSMLLQDSLCFLLPFGKNWQFPTRGNTQLPKGAGMLIPATWT